MQIDSIYKKIILVFLFWTAFGFFFALQGYTGSLYLGQPNSFWSLVPVWLISGYSWLILTPVVLFFAKRFVFKSGQIQRNLLIHLIAGSVISLAHLSLVVIFRHLFLRGINEPFTFIETFQRLLLSNINFDFLVYWILIAIWNYREINRNYIERERESAEYALKNSQLETKLAQSQLNSLKSQLQPHFLFNTLNSISALIHDNPKTANEMLVQLSELLRNALKSENTQEVTLKDELAFLRSYLEIEQIRLQDRLTVKFELDESTLEAKIPNLILQPIVENAIKHGIALLSENGEILIESRRKNGILELSVSDNGVGINGEMKESNGIGLKNTRERLERLYGERHTFEIISDGGVCVKIKIPLIKDNE